MEDSYKIRVVTTCGLPNGGVGLVVSGEISEIERLVAVVDRVTTSRIYRSIPAAELMIYIDPKVQEPLRDDVVGPSSSDINVLREYDISKNLKAWFLLADIVSADSKCPIEGNYPMEVALMRAREFLAPWTPK